MERMCESLSGTGTNTNPYLSQIAGSTWCSIQQELRAGIVLGRTPSSSIPKTIATKSCSKLQDESTDSIPLLPTSITII